MSIHSGLSMQQISGKKKLLKWQFHNVHSNFRPWSRGRKADYRNAQLDYRNAQLGSEKWEKYFVPIMMLKIIDYTISIFSHCMCKEQDAQNWYSWSNKMRFLNMCLELVACVYRLLTPTLLANTFSRVTRKSIGQKRGREVNFLCKLFQEKYSFIYVRT